MVIHLTGKDVIDDGARRLAIEYAAMLSRAGVSTRRVESEDDDGMACILVESIYGDMLALVSGTPGPKGYAVVACPFRGEEGAWLFARNDTGAFLDDETRDETLVLLRDAGLLPPAEGGLLAQG